MAGSIVFVHGTGVRLAGFKSGIATIKHGMEHAGIYEPLVECAWGDVLGVAFEGRSLPDPPDDKQLQKEAEALARWGWLFEDPLVELDRLSVRSSAQAPPPRPARSQSGENRLKQFRPMRPAMN